MTTSYATEEYSVLSVRPPNPNLHLRLVDRRRLRLVSNMRILLLKSKLLLRRSTNNTNVSLTANIHSLLVEDIDINWVDPSINETSHGDQHRHVERLLRSDVLEMGGDSTGHGREGSAS